MTYRVVQWATGGVGGSALKAILVNPDLELVGVYAYNPGKEGVDAGRIVGRPDTGVLATRSRDEILALDADVVLHCPSGHPTTEEHDDDVVELLRSGKNVISTCGYASPWLIGDEYVARLEAACREGNSTLFGTGINPEHILARIPAGLSGMCTDVVRVNVAEIANMAGNPNTGLMVDMLGMGKEPAEVNLEGDGARYLMAYTPQIVDLLARHLGVRLERVEPEFELALATKDLKVAVTEVRKGTVAGVRLALNGYRDEGTEPFIRLEFFWYVQDGLPGYPVPRDDWYRWTIDIEGKPTISAVVDVGGSMIPGLQFDEEDEPGFWATAAVALRAIPDICAAPAGLFRAPVFAPWTPRMTTPASV
jgi:hypothetical protein